MWNIIEEIFDKNEAAYFNNKILQEIINNKIND